MFYNLKENTNILEEFTQVLGNWLRDAVRDEVEKALEADRAKRQPEKHYTRDEVCAMAHITLPTLWAKTKEGKITATRVGRRVLYSENEVKRFLDRK